MSAPETVADVARVVAAFPKVRAVGVGHSWNKRLFCAGDGRDAADVVVSKVRAVGRSVTGDKTPLASDTSTSTSSRSLLGGDRRSGSGAPDEDPRFKVDAAAATVSADAGATVRELLDFLRDFRPSRIGANDEDEDASENDRSSTSSRSALDALRRLRRKSASTTRDDGGDETDAGYTLPAFPWFVDQTVGGAVATATHGSSLRHGSLSSQVVSLTVALANGTVCELSDSTRVFNAARAGLGRFGVVVRARLKIQKNTPVRRTTRETSPEALASLVAKASDAFAASVAQ